MVAPRWRLRRTTMQSRGPHRAAAGGPASRPRCCWPLPASPRTRQRLLATRHSCERQAEGGNAVHAHRGGAVHTAGLSDAAGLWRDVEIESKAECLAVGSTPVPHLARMCSGLSPQTIKLLYCGAASPCSFPSRLDTNGVRCELESFTRSPDPSFSSSARELAATRRTFGAQKRAITASHRLSP